MSTHDPGGIGAGGEHGDEHLASSAAAAVVPDWANTTTSSADTSTSSMPKPILSPIMRLLRWSPMKRLAMAATIGMRIGRMAI